MGPSYGAVIPPLLLPSPCPPSSSLPSAVVASHRRDSLGGCCCCCDSKPEKPCCRYHTCMARTDVPCRRDPAVPSFSSSLLDAIYRSMDEDESCRPTTKTPTGRPDPALRLRSTATTKKQSVPTAASRAHSRCNVQAPQKRFPVNLVPSTSSESSFEDFSSSDGEYMAVVTARRMPHRLPSLIPPFSPTTERREPTQDSPYGSLQSGIKSSTGSCCTNARTRTMKKKAKTKTPPSPGKRLASIFNILWSAAGQNKKTSAYAVSTTTAANGGASPPHLVELGETEHRPNRPTSSLRKYPPIKGDTTLPGDDRRSIMLPCVDDEQRGHWGVSTVTSKHLCEMTKRGVQFVEEDSSDEDLTDASSDLFELEDLTMDECGGWNGELPLYETTRVATNLAIARTGLLVNQITCKKTKLRKMQW